MKTKNDQNFYFNKDKTENYKIITNYNIKFCLLSNKLNC